MKAKDLIPDDCFSVKVDCVVRAAETTADGKIQITVALYDTASLEFPDEGVRVLCKPRREFSVAWPAPRGDDVLGPVIHDTLETMRAEINEAVELMRPHFPDDSEATLIARAESWRQHRYRHGHWPDFAEMARTEAEARKLADAALVVEAVNPSLEIPVS